MKKELVRLKHKLDELHDQGKEIKVTWEGGNDSGGFSVFIGGEELPYGDVLSECIIAEVESRIDYGSWAGDFYADGQLIYDRTDGGFTGEGKETNTEQNTIGCKIKLTLPKALNFDRVDIDLWGDIEYEPLECKFRFQISNGPVFEEHSEIEKEMSEKIVNEIDKVSMTIQLDEDSDLRGMYNDWVIQRSEMEEEGDDLVFYIEQVDYSYGSHKYQNHFIYVSEDSMYGDFDDDEE